MEWVRSCAQSLTSTSNSITVKIPSENGILTIHHDLDEQQRFHTHIALHKNSDVEGNPIGFVCGFYRHPDGEVIGPIFRD